MAKEKDVKDEVKKVAPVKEEKKVEPVKEEVTTPVKEEVTTPVKEEKKVEPVKEEKPVKKGDTEKDLENPPVPYPTPGLSYASKAKFQNGNW